MGMEFTEHLTHNTRGFLGLPSIGKAKAIHSEQHSALHRFEAVANIRKRPGYDDRHRIVDVGAAHLVIYLNRLYITMIYFIDLFLVIHVIFRKKILYS